MNTYKIKDKLECVNNALEVLQDANNKRAVVLANKNVNKTFGPFNLQKEYTHDLTILDMAIMRIESRLKRSVKELNLITV